eukprot:scaffold1884_cov359-Pinguiococcus_pyrenoidosus.AAC.2
MPSCWGSSRVAVGMLAGLTPGLGRDGSSALHLTLVLCQASSKMRASFSRAFERFFKACT